MNPMNAYNDQNNLCAVLTLYAFSSSNTNTPESSKNTIFSACKYASVNRPFDMPREPQNGPSCRKKTCNIVISLNV